MLSRSIKTTTRRLPSVCKKPVLQTGAKIGNVMMTRSIQTESYKSVRDMNKMSNNMLNFKRFASQTVKVPEMAESITEGTLSEYLKEVGDFVNQDETIATIETDKIDVEVNAPVSGTITERLVEVEENVTVGQDLVKIEEGEAPAGGAKEESKEESKEEPKKEESAAPKKEEAPKPKKEEAPKPKKEEPKKEAKKETSKSGEEATFTNFSRNEERVKMNRMRLRIAERLKESQNTNASLTTFNEVDMTNLMEMRKLYKDEFLDKTGIKLGFMGAFAKASTLAMKEIPSVGASIENNDTLVFRDYADISVAVATPKGLVTPIVRNAESLSILGIEKSISDLGRKARDGKLTLEDMTGGNFTISNGGIFGSLYGTPIINLPQTSVLGLHGVKQRPVTVNGQIESRPMMYLALTYDHRVLDGREAVIFLRTIKELIEDPRKMLLLQ
ncbi:DEHA2E03894p [Debaryomyces hansenii CBS767]|jgi:2-oxoglutarate dehydrogenase E2 component (dihydrolipoamide succinyltransferase)|uniref:dihydrolipoyllysine-residue succinyltransferase n=1 Tax=Debaryomyces hansenii (strain ATCC 36239 / CBS 767 / BCRC 21394 / JCM 1990 / NBRC 0083 / IGC 2968) TaxID=284592 RepID=Q6BQM7_DEBHA|nr:DEHA2E03894p [Debaryomyces hansenii CBS767]CAG87711.1 DEHA2E03894p [Debaryomyces hansenii CBS767]|eukprot:XP_459493.1 DEHA2E03894p [Debaryomyces hansenii CBS767]